MFIKQFDDLLSRIIEEFYESDILFFQSDDSRMPANAAKIKDYLENIASKFVTPEEILKFVHGSIEGANELWRIINHYIYYYYFVSLSSFYKTSDEFLVEYFHLIHALSKLTNPNEEYSLKKYNIAAFFAPSNNFRIAEFAKVVSVIKILLIGENTDTKINNEIIATNTNSNLKIPTYVKIARSFLDGYRKKPTTNQTASNYSSTSSGNSNGNEMITALFVIIENGIPRLNIHNLAKAIVHTYTYINGDKIIVQDLIQKTEFIGAKRAIIEVENYIDENEKILTAESLEESFYENGAVDSIHLVDYIIEEETENREALKSSFARDNNGMITFYTDTFNDAIGESSGIFEDSLSGLSLTIKKGFKFQSELFKRKANELFNFRILNPIVDNFFRFNFERSNTEKEISVIHQSLELRNESFGYEKQKSNNNKVRTIENIIDLIYHYYSPIVTENVSLKTSADNILDNIVEHRKGILRNYSEEFSLYESLNKKSKEISSDSSNTSNRLLIEEIIEKTYINFKDFRMIKDAGPQNIIDELLALLGPDSIIEESENETFTDSNIISDVIDDSNSSNENEKIGNGRESKREKKRKKRNKKQEKALYHERNRETERMEGMNLDVIGDDREIQCFRYCNIEFLKDHETAPIDISIANSFSNSIIHSVGLTFGPWDNNISCKTRSNLISIRGLTLNYFKKNNDGETILKTYKIHTNGFRGAMKIIKHFYIETLDFIVNGRYERPNSNSLKIYRNYKNSVVYKDSKGKEQRNSLFSLNKELFSSIAYWIFNLETDIYEIDVAEDIVEDIDETGTHIERNVSAMIIVMHSVLYDRIVSLMLLKLASLIRKGAEKHCDLLSMETLINTFLGFYKINVTESFKNDLITNNYFPYLKEINESNPAFKKLIMGSSTLSPPKTYTGNDFLQRKKATEMMIMLLNDDSDNDIETNNQKNKRKINNQKNKRKSKKNKNEISGGKGNTKSKNPRNKIKDNSNENKQIQSNENKQIQSNENKQIQSNENKQIQSNENKQIQNNESTQENSEQYFIDIKTLAINFYNPYKIIEYVPKRNTTMFASATIPFRENDYTFNTEWNEIPIKRDLCKHEIEWEYVENLRRIAYKNLGGLDRHRDAYESFISDYSVDVHNGNTCCRICGMDLGIPEFADSGVFDSNTQTFVTNSAPTISLPLEEFADYKDVNEIIAFLRDLLDRFNNIMTLNLYDDDSPTSRYYKQMFIKSIIDIIINHNKHILPIWSDEKKRENLLNRLTSQFGIIKRANFISFFNVSNDIMLSTPPNSEYYNERIRERNLCILYFILVLFTEISGIQLSNSSFDRDTNIFTFEKSFEGTFKGLKIHSSINDSESKSLISDYPVLCYIIYVASYFLVEHNLWIPLAMNANTNIGTSKERKDIAEKKASRIERVIIIHTVIALLNTVLEEAAKVISSGNIASAPIYLILVRKFFTKLHSDFNDYTVISLLKKAQIRFSSRKLIQAASLENPAIGNLSPDEEKMSSLLKMIKVFDSNVTRESLKELSINDQWWLLYDLAWEKHKYDIIPLTVFNPIGIRYAINVNLIQYFASYSTSLTNCPDGNFHSFKGIKGRFECIRCGHLTGKGYEAYPDSFLNSSLDVNLLNEQYYESINRISYTRCPTGDLHVLNNSGICMICKRDISKQPSMEDIKKLSEVISNKRKQINENLIKELEETKQKEENIKSELEILWTSYEKIEENNNNNNNVESQPETHIIDLISSFILPQTDLSTSANNPYYLIDDVYIINRNYDESLFNTPVIFTESDGRIIKEFNQTIWKEGKHVYKFINKKVQVEMFYDAQSLKLIAYKEKKSKPVYVFDSKSYLKINRSLKNRLIFMNFKLMYVSLETPISLQIFNPFAVDKQIENITKQKIIYLLKTHMKLVVMNVDNICVSIKKLSNISSKKVFGGNVNDEDNDINEDNQTDYSLSVLQPGDKRKQNIDRLDSCIYSYAPLLTNLKIDNAFDDWTLIRMREYTYEEITKLEPIIDNFMISMTSDIIDSSFIYLTDSLGNYFMNYVFIQLKKILDINDSVTVKTTFCKFFIEIINILFKRTNVDDIKFLPETIRMENEYEVRINMKELGRMKMIKEEESKEEKQQKEEDKEAIESIDTEEDYFDGEDPDRGGSD